MNPTLRRCLVSLLFFAPLWALALDFGFDAPRDPDDVAAVNVMRDLAQRIVPVYQDGDTDAYLANVAALQIVSGAYGAAFDSSNLLRQRHQGKPFDALLERAVADGLYAQARALEASERLSFADAYARAFQQQLTPLEDPQAAAVMARLQSPPETYRDAVKQAFDRWRGKDSLPQADAVALVRAWLAYESRRSTASLLPTLVAADGRRRYTADGDVWIPVRAGVVIHASIVRPSRAKAGLPTLLRFTLDPAEDDARRSATKGYVGVTAYARGRLPDGQGSATPFMHDSEDASAVIEWIARQPWSDGRVGMLGDGYSGYAAWAAAKRKPAALKAIATTAPMAPGIDFPMAGQVFRNEMVHWAQRFGTAERPPASADTEAERRALSEHWYRQGQAYWDIDLALLGERSKLVRNWLTHPSHDRYWQKFLPSARQFAQIDIPVLTIAGYYGAEAGALYFHDEHRRHRPRADNTLLIGPYDAATVRQGQAASLRGYTPDPVARLDLPDLRYQWFDHVLKGARKPELLKDRVNYQVMGANQWRHAATLDAAARPRLRLYLDTAAHDGPRRLLGAPRAPGGEVTTAVDLADRRDTSPTLPEALRFKQATLPMRNGTSFASDPLPKDTVIEGRLSGVLDLTPSRQDVDLTVALYEQTPQGEYQLLFEPYDFRASYAGHRSTRRLLRAGERQALPFTTERLTARKIGAGSRLVLVLQVQQRPDRQVNYGSGKDVNTETIAEDSSPADGLTKHRLQWHEGSHIDIGTSVP